VTGAVRTVFEKFAELALPDGYGSGSGRGAALPRQSVPFSDITWSPPTYTVVHGVLKSPVYAGAYAYGRTRHERCLDPDGRTRTRMRQLPRAEWAVLLRDHHEGFIDWETYEVNQARLAANTRPGPHDPAGAVREGAALLQGLAVCGTCGRKLLVYYQGRHSTPGYYCANGQIANGRAQRCLRVARCISTGPWPRASWRRVCKVPSVIRDWTLPPRQVPRGWSPWGRGPGMGRVGVPPLPALGGGLGNRGRRA